MLKTIEASLSEAGIDNSRFESRLIAAHALKVKVGYLPLIADQALSEVAVESINIIAQRRKAREPLQQILGSWSFINSELAVTTATLCPRPETEEMTVRLLELIRARHPNGVFAFADIGTGTGAIGLSILQRFNGSKGFLTDISAQTLKVAAENSSKVISNFSERASLMQGYLLRPFHSESLDLVVSNPPYIPSPEISSLMPEVRDFEPRLALDGGPDGLDLIRELINDSLRVLKPRGLVAFEHGHGQRELICKFIPQGFTTLALWDDAYGSDRFIILYKSAMKTSHSTEKRCAAMLRYIFFESDFMLPRFSALLF